MCEVLLAIKSAGPGAVAPIALLKTASVDICGL